MKIRVDACWSGGDRYSFRLTNREGRRLIVPAKDGEWTRKVATEALDSVEYNWGYDRKNVRWI